IFSRVVKVLLSTRTMSQEITKDPFEFCDSSSVASHDGYNNDEINNKLNLLLTNIERIDKNVLKLNQLVDVLISKQTIMEITLSSINADYVNTREIIYKTETSCSKILNIIEERALSYEHAVEDAAKQIQMVTQKIIKNFYEVTVTNAINYFRSPRAPDGSHFNQTNNVHETCINLARMVDNDNIYQTIDLNNEEHNIAENNVSVVIKTANDMIHALYEPINKRKTSEDDTLLVLHSQVMQGPIITITGSSTPQTYQVNAEKYNRAKHATDTALLTEESGFNNLLSLLFSALFSNEELKLSSIHGSVQGTKVLCLQRVHTIDEHMYNIYGQRYITYRQTKKFKDTINKKCCRLRS
ncbi:unnamed protein product, partial [Didymodactylos carnosus]